MTSRTIKKRIAFALIAMALSVGIAFVAILAADLYLHSRAEKYASVNAWGYRGPRVGRKRDGERRIVVVGGSTALGYCVTPANAFPAQLESQLRPMVRKEASVTVVNLAMNSQGAYAFPFDLEDYKYLRYDAAIFYEGYNDLRDGKNLTVARRLSPVFRLTGYFPIFPIFFHEKALALRYGDISAGYWKEKTVFKPGLANRTSAAALDAAIAVSDSLQRQLARLDGSPAPPWDNRRATEPAHGCPARWAFYCTSQFDAITYAIERGVKVVVVTQPYIDDRHREQQQMLREMLAREFPAAGGLRYVNLGPLLDIEDKRLFYDGMHANDEGNRLIASHLVEPVAELMPDVLMPPAPR